MPKWRPPKEESAHELRVNRQCREAPGVRKPPPLCWWQDQRGEAHSQRLHRTRWGRTDNRYRPPIPAWSLHPSALQKRCKSEGLADGSGARIRAPQATWSPTLQPPERAPRGRERYRYRLKNAKCSDSEGCFRSEEHTSELQSL